MSTKAMSDKEALAVAQRIHAEHLVIDSLSPNFIAEWVVTPAMIELGKKLQAEGKKRYAVQTALADYTVEHCATDPEFRRAYLDYWKRAGVTACNNTLYSSGSPDSAWETALFRLARAGRFVSSFKGEMIQAGSAADIEAAHRQGKAAVIYNLQNSDPVGDKLDRVDMLYSMGLRALQLTYNLRNRFGDGCLETRDGGLSRFGEALIQKLNERRIMVDVSHGSPLTALDAVSASSVPVIASHTAARAISGHPRGLPDDVLKAIADKGGYAGVVIVPAFVTAVGDDRAQKQGKPAGWATLDGVVDHIVHLVNVMGADHVGIGTDFGKPYYNVLPWPAEMVKERTTGFDWVGWRPEHRLKFNDQCAGMETWDKWPNLTAAMLRRGIPEATVIKIVGANFLRVFREICG